MLIADSIFVNNCIHFRDLLNILLTKDNLMTLDLTSGHFLTLIYGSRKKAGPQNRNEKTKTKK